MYLENSTACNPVLHKEVTDGVKSFIAKKKDAGE